MSVSFKRLPIIPLLVISCIGIGACTERAKPTNIVHNVQDNNVPVIAPRSMAEWLLMKKKLTDIWQEHLMTIARVQNLLVEYEKAKNDVGQEQSGLNLTSRNNIFEIQKNLENEAQALKNQGVSIENYSAMLRSDATYSLDMARVREMYMKMGNLPAEQYVTNQKGLLQNSRLAIDNDGARVEVFGKVLENQSKHLDNILKSLEIVLKGFYANGYRNYVQSYIEYSEQIQKVWRTVGRANAQINAAIGSLNQYRRQSAVCEARRKRIMHHKFREANSEISDKIVSLSAVPRLLDKYTSTVAGESCLHKTLLTSQFRDVGELFKLEYQVSVDGNPVGVFCPQSVDLDIEGLNVMDYPQPAIDKETFRVRGFFQPLTYYQVFRLITDNGADVKISAAPVNESSAGCNSYVPGTRKYVLDSFAVESSFAETYDVSTDLLPTESRGYRVDYGGIPTRNQSYRLFLDRVAGILRKTEECVDDLSKKKLASVDVMPLGDSTPADAHSDGPALKNGSGVTDFFRFFDDDFPLMSATVRDCMKVAEHYRYKAFTQLEATDAMIEILKKATKLDPPRSPHPVQFQPINVPNARAGNDVF